MTQVSVLPGQPVLIDGVQYRVVRRTGDDRIAVENVTTLAQSNFTDADFTKLFSAGKLHFELKEDIPRSFDPEYADFPLLSDELKQIAFKRQRYVLAVLQRTSKLSRPVVKRVVWDVMREIGDDKPPSYSSICRWVKKWTASHDIRGLVPDFHARGRKEHKLNIESIEIMTEVIEEFWKSKPRQTRQTIYEFVKKRIHDANLGRPENEKLDMPSERTIRREIARLDRKEVMAARYGSKEANEAFHQVMMLETVDRPNQRVEIDDTPLDIVVVDSLYRTPLGRPYLTVTIDTYSRLITGFVVTFSPPSADTVMLCVRHAILDKSYVAEKYPSIKNEWIACGKMNEVVSDHHSSFKHHGLEDAFAGLKIITQQAPKGRSWLRPHVEGFFRTVGVNLLHQMPGTTYSNIVKRGRENPAKSAAFTLDEFIYLMHLWVIDYRNQKKIRGHGVPHHVYENGCKRAPIRMPRSIADLNQLLMSSTDAKLTRAGVTFEKLQYNSPDLSRMLRLGDAPKSVKIRYNPMNISEIWVLDPETLRFFVVPAVDQDYTHDLSLDEHKAIYKYGETLADDQMERAKLFEVRAMFRRFAREAIAATKYARQAGKRLGRATEKFQATTGRASFERVMTDRAEAVPANDPGEMALTSESSVKAVGMSATAPEDDEFQPNVDRIQPIQRVKTNV